MKNFLNFAGLAKRAGHIKIGEEAVAAARAKKARLIIIASDAAGGSKRRAEHMAAAAGIPAILLPATKAELGAVLGKAECAAAAVTDTGMAAAMLEKLRLEYPSEYEKQDGTLKGRLRHERDREREARAHERNLKIKKARKRDP